MVFWMLSASLPAVKGSSVKKIIPYKTLKASIYIIHPFAVKKCRGDDEMVKCLFLAVEVVAPPLFGRQFIP